MQVINGYQNCPEIARQSVVALGNFDGVHLGHQRIINKTIDIAKQNYYPPHPSAVLTFEPHPITLFQPNRQCFRLSTLNEKSKYIDSLGIDFLFVIDFDDKFSNISANDFIETILVKYLDVRHIVIGHDFIFGHRRKGNANLLKKFSKSHRVNFTQIDAIGNGEYIFSSTFVRQALKDGNLTKVYNILGRYHQLSGTVISGEKRGRTIGFPTANFRLEKVMYPKNGVYAVYVHIENMPIRYKGVANIGNRPTFDGSQNLVEVHLFDFSEDIYGRKLSIELVNYLREEKKFSSFERLKSSIESDCNQAKSMLS